MHWIKTQKFWTSVIVVVILTGLTACQGGNETVTVTDTQTITQTTTTTIEQQGTTLTLTTNKAKFLCPIDGLEL